MRPTDPSHPSRRSACAALLSAAGLLAAGSTSTFGQSAPKVIRIGSPDLGTAGKPSFGAGPFTVAQVNQWLEQEFEKDGIRVEWNFFRGAGPAVHEALSAKQLDIVALGDLASVIGRSRGLATRFIHAQTRGTNSYLATAPGVDIRTVADLKGRKVSVLKGTAYQRPFDNLLAGAGLSEKDVRVISLDWPTSKAAVVSRDIDATFGGADLVELKSKGVNIPITTKGRGTGFTIDSGVLATDEFASRYPELTARLVKQLVRASHWASQEANRESFIRLSVAASGHPEPVVRTEYDGEDLTSRFSPLIDDALIADYQGVLDDGLRLGLVRQTFDVRDWFQPGFVQQALRELKLEKFWTARDAGGKAQK